MADNLVDAEENRLLDLSLPDSTLYLGLTSDSPTDGSAGTELVGNGYARVAIPLSVAASGGSKANSAEMLFAAATGSDWAEIQGFNVWDAATSGNRRWYRALSAPERRTVQVGDQYRVASGALTFTLS